MTSIRSFLWILTGTCLLAGVSSARVTQQQHLQPEPTDKTTIESQLKRFKGQTQFLNVQSFRYGGGIRAGAPAALEAKSAGANAAPRREQQESDLFKVGKAGSKLLFLLNDERGLQSVSFAAGVTAPALLGRAAATGNYPENMYYDAAHDRLIVLERLWVDDAGNYNYTENQSRLLVYDVSKPEAPKVAQELAIDGEIADSRLVGNVLYLATSIRPDWRERYDTKEAKGLVYSIQLGQPEIKVIERAELALPTSARENMNIVEIEQADGYHYYLIAILSESRWGWWDRQSLVEVVDISDPKGDVKPLMVVSAKGRISERSQTTIKNDTLIVVSNYRNEEQNAVSRIAVESFKLPTAQSEMISEDEAQFRKLNIERQLKGKSDDMRDPMYAKLVQDPQLGVQGRFVKTADGHLRKLVADSMVTVGDTTGLNASLQDVRFVDNLLYVFWVPAKQVDPFDLFDISQPEKEIKYIKRLQFDGWIERAIPVRYKNRNFVLGLGHIVPNVNNEHNTRRYPQAMLFEITGSGANARQMDLAQITLDKGNFYTDFNGNDRDVELRMTDAGKGSLMFEVWGQYKNEWVSGGKLIQFNLDAAVNGAYDQVFSEGGLLVADSSWLKRVFTNTEIDRINTFSNTSLATYDVGEKVAADKVGQAISVLELARNIEAYVDLPGKGRYEQGVQIIRQDNDRSSTTIVRTVDARKADSDKAEVRSEAKLTGEYVAHTIDSRDGNLLVATREYRTKGTGENRSYETAYLVHHLGMTDKGGLSAQTIDLGAVKDNYRFGSDAGFTQLKSGGLLFRVGSELVRVAMDKMQRVAVSGCETDNRKIRELQILNGSLYAALTETVMDATRQGIEYQRNFLAPLTVSGDSALCGAAVNIPGKAISLSEQGHLVTEDSRFVDFVSKSYETTDRAGKESVHTYFEVETETALESLRLSDGKSTLVDDFLLGEKAEGKIQPFGKERFGYFESEDASSNYYGGPRRLYPYFSSSPAQFVAVSFDKDLTFTREVFVMPEEFLKGGSLKNLFADPSEAGSILGVVTSNRKLQVVRWSAGSSRPALLKVSALDPRFEKQKAASSVVIPYGIWTWRTRGTGISFNPALHSIQVPQGLAGVAQVYLE